MESNEWAICINLDNLKEFDDLFENKCSVPKNCPHYVYSQSHKKSL